MQHRQRCHATFTCIDCSTTFQGTAFQSHTSCISEAEKYQKSLYKNKKQNKANNNGSNAAKPNNGTQTTKPVSLVSELKQKEMESTSAIAPVVDKANNKRKNEEKQESEKKKKKKEELSQWSEKELHKDEKKSMELALRHVLKDEKKALSFKDARKKTLKLIQSHAKFEKSKDAEKKLKNLFDESVNVSLENDAIVVKRVTA
ncbi:hypothetical protein EC973_004522 [Apophysomyces ossiformis]|uniref:Zinc finger C2H2 LYAR-type domain-containing protein n=1 Tax=Apophysomyces ossiformis TaxID=679940 RepID=A0A8H7BFU0_9FUNG|nr:hypothetical protein EC973_004522 [Apophysomyces ossiformis]